MFNFFRKLAGKSIMRFMLMLGLWIVVCIPTLANAAGFTLEDLARIRYVDAAAVSPDGKLIAYTLHVQRNPFEDENGEAWKELHLVDLDGNSRAYVTGKVNVSEINWTPDGQTISYLAKRGDDEKESLYIIPVDGGESRRLLEFGSDISGYSWAPDSRRVAFLAKDSLSEEKDTLSEIGFDQEVYEEDWRSVRVWIYDTGLESDKPHPLNLPGSASMLSWSPNGKLLAMALAPTALTDDRYMYRKINLVEPETGKVTVTFGTEGKLGSTAWSPDGKHLAIIRATDKNDPSAGRLVVGSTDDGKLTNLISTFEGHVNDIAWTDDNTIIYRASKNVYSEIGSIKHDGTKRMTVVNPTKPAFSDMYYGRNGKTVALIGSGHDFPWELYYFELGKSLPRRLTYSNPWLEEIDFARQEVVKYKARDGVEIFGLLIYPLDRESKTQYPLILCVHGGPESHRKDGWLSSYSNPGQVAAARGFAVLYPNYRGSTGRGVAFSKMGQADYAGREFNDLIDGIEHLVKIGLVDREKVGLTGGSYGGFASAWGATAITDLFAASVMGFGISDIISKFGTTDIPQEMYLVHAQKWPWDDWQWYLERSPIYHAKKSKTPVLILHGKEDARVHPSQSMELYRYLKTVGQAPVRLVFYPDEKHGNRKAAGRYDYSLRLIRWMEHYLKGPGGDPPPYELDYNLLNPEKSDNK
jgi:dipeptidyl aminopeptidase/acylaminoacyl peptidase